MDVTPPPGTLATATKVKWDTLDPPLSDLTLRVLKEKLGYEYLTPVQAATLPEFLRFKDVAVEAPTGSGKTIAFVVPILEKLLKREDKLKQNEVGAIIITPTRELAQQIHQVILSFTEEMTESPLSVLLLIGGTEVHEDMAQFRNHGGHIVVATPGRLDDIMNRMGMQFKVKELEVLVLDEADRLLDLGFHVSITNIISRLPKQRRTGLFSATLTRQVNELLKAGLRNPSKISVKVEDKATKKSLTTPVTLTNYFYSCNAEEKLELLVQFLKAHPDEKVIVFFVTTASVNYFWKVFEALKLLNNRDIYSLHGQIPHKKRNQIYKKFVQPGKSILFTTDVAARGLDFDDIDWVVQFDPPQDPNFFVHRIGRTARIGRDGKSLLFLMHNEDTYIEFLKNRNILLKNFEDLEVKTTGILTRTRNLSKTQRELTEKSILAFISYIRAYKEHHCHFIFRLNTLNMGSLARLFGLVRLPKMPELNNIKIDFEEEDIDMESIPFKDKQREKQRKQAIKNKEAKEELRKLEAPKEDDALFPSENESDDDSEENELEDFANEAKLLKKLKRKEITEEEYERLTGENELEEQVLMKSMEKKKAKKQIGKKRKRR